MNIEEATNRLWQSTQQNSAPVSALKKTLTMDDAYKVQLGILARRQQTGEKLSGWKIGLSAAGARQAFGLSTPISAYLLASRHFSSGQNFVNDDCNKLTPTKTPSQSQLILIKKASAMLVKTMVPATARIILSFMFQSFK